ncbi:EEF1A lysine methyltransferase 2 [Folsomia candida]|uniref:EEF1A lysine methyltransferase 2 n=1 Tax=Folsomia candida TaxID=158441 RepID=UPI000B8F809E|nr:EEF1A lysine methyltransferase 2 [Folsomia candida]XP_021949975.1 EEF1A lysine methyltransferase 2 [Folsomia candida]
MDKAKSGGSKSEGAAGGVAEDQIEDLEGSELGTKEHWEKAYQNELENYNRHGIIGDIWFGDDIMMKIVRHIVDETLEVTEQSSICDIGCGNGSLMLEFAREGYTKLTGLDYSENALKMAKALLTGENFTATFKTFDLLKEYEESEVTAFDVCLDKGTFDAISLCPNISAVEGRKRYFNNMLKLLKDNGIFVLASCNWTSKELVTFAKDLFDFTGIIPTQEFKFGGKSGSVVSIIILRKKRMF